jgi:membrane protein YqaA with SNARE-associated domain
MAIYILNFLIIFVSITLFIAPFFLWFIWRYPQKKQSFNGQLELFFSSKQANWLVFTWAAAEAVVWFVIPEFLLILVVFMRIKNKRQMLLYDIYGTIVGTIIAFSLHLQTAAIEKLPYIQPKMVEQVHDWYTQSGILALLHQPFSGVPYKVFTISAPNYELSLALFIVFAVAVRLSRYLVMYGIVMLAYPALHKLVYKNYLWLYAGSIAIFSILLYKTYSSFA